MNLVMREARYSDSKLIGDLMCRNGLLNNKVSTDHWAGLWQTNPALLRDQSIPIGWVLEKEGNIVGYLGNIPLHYHYQDKRLLATAARGFAVDVEYRSQSFRLVAAFFSQKNVDIFLNTTANASAGSVFHLCKAEKIPQPGYDKALFWIVSAQGLVGSVLRKRGYGSVLASVGGAVLAPALQIEGLLRQRGPLVGAAAFEVNVLEPQGIDEKFDDFWQRTLAERPQCLLADRSLRALRWHFGHRGAGARQAKFVCARRSGKLMGYAVLTREDSADIGLRRSRITDLIAENDDPGLIDALLHAAFGQARVDGSHILELIGFPARIRGRFAAGQAYVRQLPSWPFWYKAVSPSLHQSLRHENVWYGSSYDGDASL